MKHSPNEPRWLNDDEMQAWLAFASALTRVPAALDAQLRRDMGITHFGYQVLAVLSEADDRSVRMSALAEEMDCSPWRLTHCVERHEKRGWVRRHVDPDDARTTFAVLTDDGMAALVAAAPGHVAIVRRHIFDPLSDEQIAQLQAIATRIAESFEPLAPYRRYL